MNKEIYRVVCNRYLRGYSFTLYKADIWLSKVAKTIASKSIKPSWPSLVSVHKYFLSNTDGVF